MVVVVFVVVAVVVVAVAAAAVAVDLFRSGLQTQDHPCSKAQTRDLEWFKTVCVGWEVLTMPSDASKMDIMGLTSVNQKKYPSIRNGV